jgi:hypothetical protein
LQLVHVLSAFPGVASAGDLDVLEGELIVVGKLLSHRYLPEGEDNDVLLAKYLDDLGVTVGLKKIINLLVN